PAAAGQGSAGGRCRAGRRPTDAAGPVATAGRRPGRPALRRSCPQPYTVVVGVSGTGDARIRQALPSLSTWGDALGMPRIVLITGANKGIGFATARLLGSRGMTVLIGSRDAGRGQAAVGSLREAGIDARAVTLDVTDEASIENAASWVAAEFGHLDVLVNNAGIALGDGTGQPSET